VMNLFNKYGEDKWDTEDAMSIFRHMTWCNGRYWTATPHKRSSWNIETGVFCVRWLDQLNLSRGWSDTRNTHRICGRKDIE
jgi:hypothetical protein